MGADQGGVSAGVGESAALPIDDAARGSRRLAWAAAAYCAVFVVWVVVHPGTPDQRELLSDLAPLPLGLATWAAALRAGGRGDAGARKAWRRIATAFFLWWLGDVVWFAQEVILQRPPFPSPADIGYLASYPVLAWGLLSLPGLQRRRAEWLKVALDAVTVLLAAAMVVWYLVVGPSVRDAPGTLVTVLNVAYPVGDLLLLFAVAVVLLGGLRRERAPWILLGGTAALVVADVAYARLSLSDSYAGGDWPDAFWMLAQCLFVVATVNHRHTPHQARSPASSRRGQVSVSNLPYAAVVLGYGLLFAVGRSEASYPLNGLLVGAGAITAVVMARQIRVTVENGRLLRQLHVLAEIDGLTSILNRRTFFEAGEELIAWSAATGRPLTVLMIDVDHFKQVNDTFGHAAGDEVLVVVSNLTRSQLRDSDVVGRYGGDELAVMIPDCGVDKGLEVAERIRSAVDASPILTADGAVRATLSIGVAETAGAADLPAALARADAALYEAKKAGRGCARAVA